MQLNYLIILAILFLAGCSSSKNESFIHLNNWEERKAETGSYENLEKGSTYLSVYSSVYSYTESNTTPLTATVSLRNISKSENVYILKSSFYNTHGELIREYLDFPIFIKPMETVEIVIHESDITGGTGANFVFDWAKTSGVNSPFFEAVMISKSGQQGLSFTTTGVEIQ